MSVWNFNAMAAHDSVKNTYQSLYRAVIRVVSQAKAAVYKSTNIVLLKMYWEIGQLIIEGEQRGKNRAEYGKAVLKTLASQLTIEFGKGFDESNLRNMRNFFLAFRIWDAVRPELSWTHYRILSRVKNQRLRHQLVNYAAEGNWNTRILQRNIDSQYLGRLLELPQNESSKASHFIKDPYLFEFLGFPANNDQTETSIEAALISNIHQFLMELGKGFAFVARQQRIATDTSDFYIDLVFYNYYLKCYVLIDLKTCRLTHEAVGQMDMYIRMYNDLKKGQDDNPTIGIILCTEKDATIVKYSVMAENEKLFASKYRLYLPDENELRQLIEADRIKFELDNTGY
ncbi:MAG TPA: PDDEXK nuclease domain-containing protein [Puia sp.]|nr:PDDEXK nuclease domain-containing protein [Puia sp.]